MKKIVLILFLFSIVFAAKAQNNDTTVYGCALRKDKGVETVGNKDSLSYFDSCPVFHGGDKSFLRF